MEYPFLHTSWVPVLEGQFTQPYFTSLFDRLKAERETFTTYPPGSLIFNAFKLTPFDQLKVVIVGQDPYHGAGEAHGLAFSVPDGVRIPPSLRNIYKEISQDLGKPVPVSGNLTRWAEQGVLLLNSSLTVRADQAASHKGWGWEVFTDFVIRTVAEQCEGVVFMLWGSMARSKAVSIDPAKHLVLQSVHPSPLSAHNGFFGNKHFSKANTYLESVGKQAIDW